MKRLSTLNKSLLIINVLVIIFSYVMFLINEFDWITFGFSIVMPIYYIFMNWLTIKSLDNNWLVLYNVITILSVMLMLLGVLSGVYPFEVLGMSMLLLVILNIIYLIADVSNRNSPKDNVLKKETIANTQDSIPNTQFTEVTNNQQIINAQNVEHNQYDNVVENNVTIDLNKLTPEQKDQILKVLLQNN